MMKMLANAIMVLILLKYISVSYTSYSLNLCTVMSHMIWGGEIKGKIFYLCGLWV